MLAQTQNPYVISKLLTWWRKFIDRATYCEGELIKLSEAFRSDAENRLFVVVDNNEIHGFALVTFDKPYNALFVHQVSTDRPELVRKGLLELAKQAGATEIFFATERNPKAWKKLLKVEQVGYVMKIKED